MTPDGSNVFVCDDKVSEIGTGNVKLNHQRGYSFTLYKGLENSVWTKPVLLHRIYFNTVKLRVRSSPELLKTNEKPLKRRRYTCSNLFWDPPALHHNCSRFSDVNKIRSKALTLSQITSGRCGLSDDWCPLTTDFDLGGLTRIVFTECYIEVRLIYQS